MRLEKRGKIYCFIDKDHIWHGYHGTNGNVIKYYIINNITVGVQTGYNSIRFYI